MSSPKDIFNTNETRRIIQKGRYIESCQPVIRHGLFAIPHLPEIRYCSIKFIIQVPGCSKLKTSLVNVSLKFQR